MSTAASSKTHVTISPCRSSRFPRVRFGYVCPSKPRRSGPTGDCKSPSSSLRPPQVARPSGIDRIRFHFASGVQRRNATAAQIAAKEDPLQSCFNAKNMPVQWIGPYHGGRI